MFRNIFSLVAHVWCRELIVHRRAILALLFFCQCTKPEKKVEPKKLNGSTLFQNSDGTTRLALGS